MARLPTIGGDDNNWGTVLNDFLGVAHDTSGNLRDNISTQKITVSSAGTTVGTRKQINLIAGTNTSLTVSDNSASDRVDVTVNSSSAIVSNLSGFSAVTNTTSDTTLASLTLPSGVIADGSIIVFETGGTLSNSSGSTINHVLRFKIGSTTVLTTSSIGISTNAADRKWHLRVVILFPTTSTQKVSAIFSFSIADTNNWGAGSAVPTGYGTASESTATAKDIVFSVQPATASSSQSMQANWASLRRLA